jgi:hypothetical protein
MNLYFHEFRAAAFSRGEGLIPPERRVLEKPRKIMMKLAFRLTEYAEVNIGYQTVASTNEKDSARKFTALLAKTVGNCHWQVTPGLKPVSAGSLVYEWLGNGVSRVLENIEENIVGNIVPLPVTAS